MFLDTSKFYLFKTSITVSDVDYNKYVIQDGETEVVDDWSVQPLVRLIRDAADGDGGPEEESKPNDMVSFLHLPSLYDLLYVIHLYHSLHLLD